MKHKNSQKAINRISSRYFKANKALNAFAVIAVILTTLLLTCVFSLGLSYAKNMKTMQLRESGTTAQFQITAPTEDQIKTLLTLPYIKNVGVETEIANIKINDKSTVYVKFIDNEQWDSHIKPCVSDINGKLPEAENEVMLSSYALSLLKIETPKIGMAVKLNLSDSEKNFILSGWYTEYSYNKNGTALLSKEYCYKNNLTPEQGGTAFLTAKKGEQNIIDRLYTDIRRNENQMIFGDTGSGYSAPPIAFILTLALLIILIILSGYLSTANVLHLSVAHGIRFYGLLKVLGADEKQISKVVRRQALLLAGIGIPTGIALGFALCFKVIPFTLGSFVGESSFPTDVSFNPFIFIGAAVFALLTVLLSCRKPAKTAAKVSPIEALRYTDGGNTNTKSVKRTSGNRLFRMAWRNVFRDKKRTSLVFASLSLGVVIFLSITSLMNAVSGEAMFNAENTYDFICNVSNSAAGISYDMITGEEIKHIPSPFELSPEKISDIINDIKETDGVETLSTVNSAKFTFPLNENDLEPILRSEYAKIIKSQEAQAESAPFNPAEISVPPNTSYEDFVKLIKKQGPLTSAVYSISEELVREYNLTADNPADITSFYDGKTCLISYYGESADEIIGKEITITSKDTGEQATVKIAGAYSTKTRPIISQSLSSKSGYLEGIYISGALMQKLNPNGAVERLCIKTNAEKEPAVKAKLAAIEKSVGESFSFTAKSDSRAEKENLIRTTKILGGGLSLLLMLTGILNFINVMFTGIITRKREFTIMQSIGMGGKQLFRLLILEGLIYVFFTLILSFILSGIIYLIISKTVVKILTYAAFSFPFNALLVISAALLVICVITSLIMYKYSVRSSVTQRLREVFAAE